MNPMEAYFIAGKATIFLEIKQLRPVSKGLLNKSAFDALPTDTNLRRWAKDNL